MPTGYTSDVKDGKITSVKEFTLKCARAFGALTHMREDNLDAAIIPVKPSDYHLSSLKTAQTELANIKKRSKKEIQATIDREFKSSLNYWFESNERRKVEKDRYETMLANVEKLNLSEDHKHLKEFMRNQLLESIKFDCSYDGGEKPVKMSCDEWLKQRIEQCEHDISYHSAKHDEEVNSCIERNGWVQSLIDALNKQA